VERFNKTLIEMLSMYTNKHRSDWDEHLPYVLFAYRTSAQESTKMDPFFLTYGRQATFPIEASTAVIGAIPSNEAYAEQIISKLNEARDTARNMIQRAQLAQKIEYERKSAEAPEFEVGDKVRVQTPLVTNGKLPKWDHTWHGPYEIKERLGAVNYRVKDLVDAGPTKVVHVRHLKSYHDPAKRETAVLLENVEQSGVIDRGNQGPPQPVVEKDSIVDSVESETRVGEVLPGEYEIEAILDKKRKKVGNKLVPHYLVKWKGFPHSENSWVRQTKIQADELVRAFDRRNLEKKPGVSFAIADSSAESDSA
jgi:hypothetical protein